MIPPVQEFMGVSEAVGFALGSGCAGYVTTAAVLMLCVVLPVGVIAWLLRR
jgi:hypothetical protein